MEHSTGNSFHQDDDSPFQTTRLEEQTEDLRMPNPKTKLENTVKRLTNTNNFVAAANVSKQMTKKPTKAFKEDSGPTTLAPRTRTVRTKLSRRLPDPDPNDSDDILRPRSHREIIQPGPTVFKIESDKWNNVPKVIFESIVALISQVDQLKITTV